MSKQTEQMVEFLGFAPMHFIDETLNVANNAICKPMANFEKAIEEEIGVQEGQKVLELAYL